MTGEMSGEFVLYPVGAETWMEGYTQGARDYMEPVRVQSDADVADVLRHLFPGVDDAEVTAFARSLATDRDLEVISDA